MDRATFQLHLNDAAATERLGQALYTVLEPGDTLLLEGPIGAGKSALARAIILAMLAAEGRREDVPSPTFTLVQTYETQTCEIWHSDLYRLTDIQDVEELGLIDAFETAICLIEWPDRLGNLAPDTALRVELMYEGDGRSLQFNAKAAWSERLSKILSEFQVTS